MTVRESLLPSAMVPGLVTVECTKGPDKGKRENVYPVDAKERIVQGDWTLVENGSVEAARLAATPLRSGMAAGIPDDHVAAEVAGIAGSVIVADSAKAAEKITAAGDDAEANPKPAATTGSSAPAKPAEGKPAGGKSDAEQK
jgi:hypothetical protein